MIYINSELDIELVYAKKLIRRLIKKDIRFTVNIGKYRLIDYVHGLRAYYIDDNPYTKCAGLRIDGWSIGYLTRDILVRIAEGYDRGELIEIIADMPTGKIMKKGPFRVPETRIRKLMRF